MFALFLIFASESPKWWDYPGFELWKFFNLALFVGLMVYVLKRANLGQAFRTRGETIKAELEKARNERDAALAKLKEVEERLAGLNDQISTIKQKSKTETEQERERIAQSTQEEISKLSAQAQREIENAAKAAKSELRRFAAEQSVRLAEDLISRDIRPEDDAKLMSENIQQMGAAR
ncbi:MAG TPA: ATP synthase F0 subunit B [Pyrinomonadaceae bacterium]|jgi:F0F1-type ATP synthase membrane subunit b/b'|nr:ATP synthase F0 subunit B [Pyrinomonadaceae bacterium]